MIALPEQTDPSMVWDLLGSYSGALAFDIGANSGQAAAVLSPHFEQVVSFEPCLESLEALVHRDLPNVTAVGVAVSDHGGVVELDETANSIRTGQLTTGTALNWGAVIGHRTVLAMPLDLLVDVFGMPDFVKIDTEGHEIAVVAGGRRTFDHGPAVLIEVHRAGNEAVLREALPHYRLRKIDHDGYGDSPMGQHHFWLEGRP